MKKHIAVVSLFCIVLVLAANACRSDHKGKETEVVHKISKEEKLAGRFVDRKMASINKVFLTNGKEYGHERKIIFLYTGYDCQSCVDKGFEIIKRIDSLYPSQKTYTVASQSNIGFDQERNEYYKYIYNDNTESIRKELDFVPTPMILKLDEEDIIIKVIFPETNSNVDKAINELSLDS
jgi:hypothetical protein